MCYALAKPKERLPKTLARGDGYLFISNRPSEGVRNEVSMVLGFPTAEGKEGSAVIGATNFALITKGDAAWVKNAAEDAAFVEAMRKGTSLTLKATSKKGNEFDRPLRAQRARAGVGPRQEGMPLSSGRRGVLPPLSSRPMDSARRIGAILRAHRLRARSMLSDRATTPGSGREFS